MILAGNRLRTGVRSFADSKKAMKNLQSLGPTRGFLVSVLLMGVLVLSIYADASNADEVPAFFLKIAKNIPRVGRSEAYDDLFKSRKNVPKIRDHESNSQPESWTSFANGEQFSRPIKRRMDYPSVDDAWAWQHFPLAIEGPRELWRTLAGYSKDTSDDIDNEIWKRKKRTGSEPVASEEN